MRTVLTLWRVRLRGAARRAVALALLVGLGGGLAVAVTAGARRTASAHDDVAALTDAAEIGVTYLARDPGEVPAIVDGLPAAGASNERVGYDIVLPDTPTAGLSAFANDSEPVVTDRPLLLEGRMPRAADEVLLNEAAAAGAGASVGDRLAIELGGAGRSPLSLSLRVVGLGAYPDEVYEDEIGPKPALVLPRAFVTAHPGRNIWGATVTRVAPGADAADLEAQLAAQGLRVDADQRDDRRQADAAIRPVVLSLLALAAIVGLATVVVGGQALHRLVLRDAGEAHVLAALGCTRRALLVADAGIGATVAVAAAAVAVAVAVVASPLFPVGQSRRLAVLQGVDVDVVVLAWGAFVLLLSLVGSVVAASYRRRRRAPVRCARSLPPFANSPSASVGVGLATARRPVPASVVAVGLGAVAAVVVLTGSMDSLVTRPRLSGFGWDLAGRDAYDDVDTAAVERELRDEPAVERVTVLTFGDGRIGDEGVDVSFWEALEGSPWPELVDGRSPEGPGEVLAGAATLDRLDLRIGDRAAVDLRTVGGASGRGSPDPVRLDVTVVGTAVSPSINLPGADTPRLDEGLLVRREDLPRQVGLEVGGALLFGLADGAGPEVVTSRFPDGLPGVDGLATEWFEAARPAEVVQSDDAVGLLGLTVGALLLVVLGTVAHGLLGFVRHRRDELATLSALGFTRAQVGATVLWQNGVVAGAALVVGVPAGVAAGRVLYRAFASDIGVLVEPVVPWPALLLTVAAALVLVQAAAVVPARRAQRAGRAGPDRRGLAAPV